MGLDSPLATPVAVLLALGLFLIILFHASKLRGWVDDKTRRRLMELRLGAAVLFGLLLLRPFWSEEVPGSGLFRVVTLADVSGSMRTQDEKGGPRRIDSLKEAFDEKKSPGLV